MEKLRHFRLCQAHSKAQTRLTEFETQSQRRVGFRQLDTPELRLPLLSRLLLTPSWLMTPLVILSLWPTIRGQIVVGPLVRYLAPRSHVAGRLAGGVWS